ncbi:MAG: FkbM family methyltransferase [Planctomycetes bacterium]|nr:FkbM family methyltransferase [Planctomycetota bacterium]
MNYICRTFLMKFINIGPVRRRFDYYNRKIVQFILRNKITTTKYRLEKLGSPYGGWVIPTDLINSSSICYCVGVGEDISFDLELIERFHCEAFAFDPVPRSAEYAKKMAGDNPKFHFYPKGLWCSDTIQRFYVPKNPKYISHSALNLQGTTQYFTTECKQLLTLMEELDHDHVDLLKLDIEGAEHRVLRNIINDRINIKIICVEFDQPIPFFVIIKTITMLIRHNYNLVNIDDWNYTFVKETDHSKLG